MRLRVLSALLVLLAAALTRSGGRAEGRGVLQPDGPRTRTDPLSGHRGPGTEDRSRHQPDFYPRDPHHKEKFIKYLAGPLYVKPKCRKHFFRLYHSSRDCSVPAYYKRCVRLLTRLTSSPPCADR